MNFFIQKIMGEGFSFVFKRQWEDLSRQEL